MRLFEIIFESASESTTIIAVAAEKPPRNTISVAHVAPASSGSARMKRSACAPLPNRRSPPNAIVSTNRLMRNR